MSRILPPEIFEGTSSVLIIQAIDMIKAFNRTFLKLWCLQTLGEKCIGQTAEYL